MDIKENHYYSIRKTTTDYKSSLMYVINDDYKYILFTYAKSGCSTVRIIHTYLKYENEINKEYFEDKHHGIQNRDVDNLLNNLNKYKDYKKILIYRNPYNRLVSLFYQKVCGIMGVTYKDSLHKEPYRLTKNINTFDKYLDKLFLGYYDCDHHFLPQKKPNIAFDQVLELSEIKNIFKDIDDNLHKKINLILLNKSKWNELEKYEYNGDLTYYDFFIDEEKLISNNKIPKYNTLLNNYTMQKIKDNYKDDFI